ncbi:cysteine hydrolase [soil metagenome]
MTREYVGGYRAVEGYDLARAALLVIDMTNDFGHPDGVYARHGASSPALDSIVPSVRRIMEASAAAGVPVILCSQFVFTGPDGRAVASPGLTGAREWLVEEGLRRNTWGTAMLESLPRADITVDKPRASGFFATPLDLLLRGLGVDTVVVVGAYTNQCIASTVRDAWALDYRVVLPPDGCAAFDPALHAATLESLSPLSAQPAIEELVERLG